MRFLVDTNIVSELRKGPRCDTGVIRWFTGVTEDQLFLSVLTVGEIRRGVESIRRRDVIAAAALEAWLQKLLHEHADRLLPVDRAIAEEWGRMSVPDPLPVIDALIAATAKIHGLTLVTRNVRDMARTGAVVLDPTDAA